MKSLRIVLLPLIIVFLGCNSFFLMAHKLLTKWEVDNTVLIIANMLFLTITLITFFLQKKALQNSNPNVFIRSVMAGMMIKMFVCIIAIIIYWVIMQEKFSRASVFAAMLVYLIYLAVEVSLVSKMNSQKNA